MSVVNRILNEAKTKNEKIDREFVLQLIKDKRGQFITQKDLKKELDDGTGGINKGGNPQKQAFDRLVKVIKAFDTESGLIEVGGGAKSAKYKWSAPQSTKIEPLNKKDVAFFNKNKRLPDHLLKKEEPTTKTTPETPQDGTEDDDIEGKGKTTTRKKVSTQLKKRARKYRVTKASGSEDFERKIKYVMRNMKSQATKKMSAGIMLKGDVGTGKTSFVRTLANILGIELIYIEVPNVIEEHITKIPFVVYKGNKVTHGTTTVDENGYEIVASESNLVSILKKKKRMTDSEWKRSRSLTKVTRDLYDKLKRRIEARRQEYIRILFLDEFYRMSSKRVGNLMRLGL